jgi:hypothetical protein
VKNQQRAAQLWPILVLAAHNQLILSYATIGRLIGVPARGLANILGAIEAYCKREKLPHLTAIVVNQRDGWRAPLSWIQKGERASRTGCA